jgi:hypothetical protein
MVALRSLRNVLVLAFGVAAPVIMSGCASAGPPPTFTETHSETGTWRSIEVREGMAKPQLWSTVVDALSSKFDIEVVERESGYVRTSYKFTTISNGKQRDNYRSRIVAKFNPDWSVLQVKSESGWLEDRNWIDGYDSQVLNDIYMDLQGRIGRVTR